MAIEPVIPCGGFWRHFAETIEPSSDWRDEAPSTEDIIRSQGGAFFFDFHGQVSEPIGFYSRYESVIPFVLKHRFGVDVDWYPQPRNLLLHRLNLSRSILRDELYIESSAVSGSVILDSAVIAGDLFFGGTNPDSCATLDRFSLVNTTIQGNLVLEHFTWNEEPVDCRGLVVEGEISITTPARQDSDLRFRVDSRELAERLHWAAPRVPIIFDPRPRATNSEQ